MSSDIAVDDTKECRNCGGTLQRVPPTPAGALGTHNYRCSGCRLGGHVSVRLDGGGVQRRRFGPAFDPGRFRQARVVP